MLWRTTNYFFSFISLITCIQSQLVGDSYSLSNTTISNQTAKGGDSENGGGGGGFGGGVFVYYQDTLALDRVKFENCTSLGGSAQLPSPNVSVGDAGAGGGFGGGTGGNGEFGGGGGGFGVISNNLVIPGLGGEGSIVCCNSGGGGGGFGSVGIQGSSTMGGNGNNYTAQPAGQGGAAGDNGTNGSYYGDGGGGGNFANGGSGGGGGMNFNSIVEGGNGGFGGGGGVNYRASQIGGNGGFGGGGGFANNSPDGSGSGGFGGGSGCGNDNTAGFAAGHGDSNTFLGQGGGGAGLGGALFLHADSTTGQGTTCSITGGIRFLNNKAKGGTGFESGKGLGQDIFMMSGSQLIVKDLVLDSVVPSAIESNLGNGVILANTDTGGLKLDTGNTAVFKIIGDHTYTGKTVINSGTLNVEGSIITPVEVNNGGVFAGNASIKSSPEVPNSGNLTVDTGGTIAPGGDNLFGLIHIDGNFVFNSGAVLDQEVDSLSNTDFIDIDGQGQINGGTLDIQAAVGNFLENQVIKIMQIDGGRVGQFSTVTMPTQLNGNPLFAVEYTENEVNLRVLADTVFESSYTGQTIQEGNPQSVVEYILDLVPTIDPNSDLGFVIESLGVLSTHEVNKALNFMHPGSFGLFEWMNLTANAQVMQTFNKRLNRRPDLVTSNAISQLEPGLTAQLGDRPFYSNAPIKRGCSRDESKHHDVWVQPFGVWSTQSRKGELRGANYESVGVIAGYDYLLTNFYVGAGLGYTYTNFRWQGSAGKGHINQFYGSIYGSYFIKYFSANLSTMIGGNYYNTDRYIRYNEPSRPRANLDRTAHSHSSGLQWTNHLGLIGDFSPICVPLQIFGNLDHFYLHNGSFSESGAKSINLRVNSKASNALRTEVGLSSSHTFQVSNGCWTPYARISWVNKTLLSSSTYRANFIGQKGTFSVSASSKGTNQWTPGIGIEFANSSGFSILINTRAELNGKMKNYSADMRLDYVF